MLLTHNAAKEFHPHWYPTSPGDRVDPKVSSFYGSQEAICYNDKSVKVASEDLLSYKIVRQVW